MLETPSIIIYKANGVPLYLGLALTNISAYIHYEHCFIAIIIAVSLIIASIIGLAVKDQAKTSMFSIIAFLPSIMLWNYVSD